MKKPIRKVVKIKDIIDDQEIYPRHKYNWLTAYDYSKSMEAGATFPDIVLADIGGKLYLVDGKHRLEALIILKQKMIRAIILSGMTKRDAFIKAIELNIANGRPLSPYEKTNLVIKLESMNITLDKISKIIQIPVKDIKKLTVNKVIHTLENQPLGLKAPLRHLAGTTLSTDVDLDEIQNEYSSHGQVTLLTECISLIENGLIDLTNPQVKELYTKLVTLLGQKYIKKSRRIKRKNKK